MVFGLLELPGCLRLLVIQRLAHGNRARKGMTAENMLCFCISGACSKDVIFSSALETLVCVRNKGSEE